MIRSVWFGIQIKRSAFASFKWGCCSGINQIDLAESVYKDPASITRILDLLIKKDYVRKRVNEADRRRYDLILTKTGQQVHNDMIEVVIVRV